MIVTDGSNETYLEPSDILKVFGLIFLFMLLSSLIPSVGAVEYSINDSGHFTWGQSTTTTESRISTASCSLSNTNIFYGICLDWNNYTIMDWSRTYIDNVVLSKTNSTGTYQLVDGDNICCPAILQHPDGDINVSVCVYSRGNGQNDNFQIYIDYDLNDQNGTHTGTGCYKLNFTSDTCQIHFNRSSNVDNNIRSGADHHGGFRWRSPPWTCNGMTQEYDDVQFSYSTGFVDDYWYYKYRYNSTNNYEKYWLNVTKNGKTTKYHSGYWKSLLEGNQTLYEHDYESSFDTTGFNYSDGGYLINFTVDYSGDTSNTVNLTIPGGGGEGGEAEGTGDTLVKFYFVNINNNALINNVTFNIYGDYSFNGTVNKTKWIYANNGDILFYNASHPDYEWEGDIYGYEGYLSVNGPEIRKVYFVPQATGDLEDSTNNTWLTILVRDAGNTSISGAEVTITDGGTWQGTTDENGYIRFEVPKNDSYTYEIEKPGYYTEVGSITVGTDPVSRMVFVSDIPSEGATATPLPTDEAGFVDYVDNPELRDMQINKFLNFGYEYGLAIFMFACLATLLFIVNKIGGKR